MLEIAVYHAGKLRQNRYDRSGPITLGRAPEGDRTVGIEDAAVAETHAEAAPVGEENRWRLRCVGSSLRLSDGKRLAAGQALEFDDAVVFSAGEATIELAPPRVREDEPATAVLQGGYDLAETLGKAPSAATLQGWFASLDAIHRWAAGSEAFFEAAAQAVRDPGGLDAGVVLLAEGDAWKVAAAAFEQPNLGVAWRRDLVDQAARTGRGLYHSSHDLRGQTTPDGFRAVVVAPILDAVGTCVGAVYGARAAHRGNQRRGVRPLEAQWVQLVAGAVAAGMRRRAAETEAARRQALVEQAFSPVVAAEIERNPDLLRSEQRELSLLFMDLRGFTPLAERLTPEVGFRLLADLLDRMTRQVMDRDGVVIDYYGDGLAAMWNAPTDQPDHAERAVQAALGMLAELPRIETDWRHVLAEPLRIGVGLHSGPAIVGNSGTPSRLKYGPRGAAVNLAARVEAATKSFGAPLLATRAVIDRLTDEFPRRRVAQTKLPGVAEAVELFEILSATTAPSKNSDVGREAFAEAVACYEAGSLLRAAELLDALHEEVHERKEREAAPSEAPAPS